jgi:DNA primase
VQLLQRAGWFADLSRKRRALDRLLPTIRATTDALTRDLYLTRASEATGVAKELLSREVDDVGEGRGRYQGPESRQAPPPAPAPPASANRRIERRARDRRAQKPGESAERELIRAMLYERAEVDALAEQLDPASFDNPELREIFQVLVRLGDETRVEEIARHLKPPAIEELQTLLEELDAIVDLRRTVSDSLNALRERQIKVQMNDITRILRIAPPEDQDALLAEKTKLQRERLALSRAGANTLPKSRVSGRVSEPGN